MDWTNMYDRRRFSALLIAWGLGAGALCVGAGATPAHAAVNCDALTTTIYTSTNPTLQTDLLTTSATEHSRSASVYGFTADPGVLGLASSRPGTDLVPVSRLYNPKTVDFLWAAGDSDVKSATERGFQVQNATSFYAAAKADSCTVPVHRFNKGEHFAFAATTAERTQLAAAGWSDQGAVFHLKAPGDTTTPPKEPEVPTPPKGTAGSFSFAVIPDTQVETLKSSDPRMNNRAQWLVNNKSALGLEYVMHIGDVVNWGALVPAQFDVATKSYEILNKGGLPYSLAIGNHDTLAVGHNGVAGSRAYGGSAYVNNPECKEKLGDKCRTPLLVRDTTAFNKAFPVSSMKNVGGVFESGKVDNMWTTFQGDGADWLVLTLEFHPRKEAVAWAKNVVESHPNHNVLVQTHSYLNGGGGIVQDNSGYGSTTGQYLFDNLIKLYPNIKMVFSGHVGNAARRVDTGVNGNKILSFLNSFHSGSTNPVRIVTVDADTGSVTSKIVAPSLGETWTQYSTTDTISLIKK